MDLQIKPGAATEDASQIEDIVSRIETDMETLNSVFSNTEDGMQLAWADEVRGNWEKYRNTDIPEAMAEMRTAAHNLQKAVEAAIQYSQQG